MNAQTPVLMRRAARTAAAKKSSGAWKVAFADFTLAMMAFFMVLWILEVSTYKERTDVASYMRTQSILGGNSHPFDAMNSPYPVDLGGNPSPVEMAVSTHEPQQSYVAGMSAHLQIPEGKREPSAGMGEKLNSLISGQYESPPDLNLLAMAFKEFAELNQAEANLVVEQIPAGLRVILRDSENRQMFQRGQVQMNPYFEDLLLKLAPVFSRIQNKLLLSGHTDGTAFNSSQYSNWELSGDRALQARQVLAAGGMPVQRVAQVSAFAETVLLNPAQPGASENRRIEILILTKKAEQQLLDLFSSEKPGNAVEQAAAGAEANQPVLRTRYQN
ncbi:flagellar motor protein MotB [Rheinheimera sp.]|uniref:flagellar motor protein MotB n=1 Tax=Rheinheimera sp. TaxID=1869214 RepID=UPI00307E09ED